MNFIPFTVNRTFHFTKIGGFEETKMCRSACSSMAGRFVTFGTNQPQVYIADEGRTAQHEQNIGGAQASVRPLSIKHGTRHDSAGR